MRKNDFIASCRDILSDFMRFWHKFNTLKVWLLLQKALPCSSLISSEPRLLFLRSESRVLCRSRSSFSSCAFSPSVARLLSCSSRFKLSSWLMVFPISEWFFLSLAAVSDSARSMLLASSSCQPTYQVRKRGPPEFAATTGFLQASSSWI